MPKTKDAFAFRDFDAQRILQRPWFKELDLARGKDEDVLRSFYNVQEKPIPGITPSGILRIIAPGEEGYLEGMLEKLDMITRLVDRAGDYGARIERHMRRLNEIQKNSVERFMSTEDKIYKQKFERTTELIKSYLAFLNSITALCDEIFLKEEMVNQVYKRNYREYFFGKRLRQARMAAGMTQQQLADKVGLKTYNAISQYEKGVSDPALPTLLRISMELKCSFDWLLGVT